MSAKELSALRERMNLSRALFARYLRTNVRTLENWEQGRARPIIIYGSGFAVGSRPDRNGGFEIYGVGGKMLAQCGRVLCQAQRPRGAVFDA